eukprot:584880-Rhodomonas_salina.2
MDSTCARAASVLAQAAAVASPLPHLESEPGPGRDRARRSEAVAVNPPTHLRSAPGIARAEPQPISVAEPRKEKTHRAVAT